MDHNSRMAILGLLNGATRLSLITAFRQLLLTQEQAQKDAEADSSDETLGWYSDAMEDAVEVLRRSLEESSTPPKLVDVTT